MAKTEYSKNVSRILEVMGGRSEKTVGKSGVGVGERGEGGGGEV